MQLERSGWNRSLVLGAGATCVVAAALVYGWGLPLYRNAQVQHKVAEVFVSTDLCRATVAHAVQNSTGTALSQALFSCDAGASKGVRISQYLQALEVSERGAITVTLNFRELSALSPWTNRLTLVPLRADATPLTKADGGKTVGGWRCGAAQDGTTVPAKYLPANCRG